MLVLVAACHALLVLGFTLRILLRGDLSPPARLAWFVVLNTLPYFGAAVYFLFGEVDIGHRAVKRYDEIFAQIRQQTDKLKAKTSCAAGLIDPLYRPAFKYAASINGFDPVSGNAAHLMTSPEESVAGLVADIDAAQDHVHVLYYIWLDDETGSAIAEALIRATQRGVTCRAMADGLGSRTLIGSDLWRKMEKAGVQLAVALPLNKLVRTILTSRLDLRNHRKITVVDGRITYCGSRNSADPLFRLKPKFAPWIDIMVRFEGPIVFQNQLLFISDWMAATGESLTSLPEIPSPQNDGFAAVVIGDGPTERRGATPQLFSNLIACARQDVTISTPYFVPDATLVEALCAAAHRGVDVTLILPARNDSWVVAAASRSYYPKLLDAGCKINEFEGGLLHAKTFTMDGMITLIGSSNLDLRSFDLNYENNILLQDAATTGAVRQRQVDYLSSSVPVTLPTVRAWTPRQRVWQNIVATIGPIL